jgi:hypothetical protein
MVVAVVVEADWVIFQMFSRHLKDMMVALLLLVVVAVLEVLDLVQAHLLMLMVASESLLQYLGYQKHMQQVAVVLVSLQDVVLLEHQ